MLDYLIPLTIEDAVPVVRFLGGADPLKRSRDLNVCTEFHLAISVFPCGVVAFINGVGKGLPAHLCGDFLERSLREVKLCNRGGSAHLCFNGDFFEGVSCGAGLDNGLADVAARSQDRDVDSFSGSQLADDFRNHSH